MHMCNVWRHVHRRRCKEALCGRQGTALAKNAICSCLAEVELCGHRLLQDVKDNVPVACPGAGHTLFPCCMWYGLSIGWHTDCALRCCSSAFAAAKSNVGSGCRARPCCSCSDMSAQPLQLSGISCRPKAGMQAGGIADCDRKHLCFA